MTRYLPLFLAGLVISAAAYAQLPARDVQLQSCAPTPSQPYADPPSRIILSNRLARPAGKSQFAGGEVVYLTGRVTDERCLPIVGAVIDIWQTGPDGKYRYASAADLASPYPVFAGSGRAVTDNMGRYSFVTLKPGAYGKQAPHIHMQLRHEDFNTYNTSMYFEGDERNAKDPTIRGLKADLRKRLEARTAPAADKTGTDARFDITLRGRSPFKKF